MQLKGQLCLLEHNTLMMKLYQLFKHLWASLPKAQQF
jgi:hypothetical protein